MKNVKESFFAFKDRLVNIGSEEPLSKLSLFVIIALDIFILSVVFQGLNEHTKQITSPDEYVPYECQEVFIRRSWSSNNFLTKLQPLVLSGHNNYSYKYDSRLEQVKTEVMHNSCREFYTKVKLVAENQKLKNLFIDRQETLKQRGQLNKSLNQSKDVYDTSLLENIADQEKDSNDLTAVKTSITSYKSEIEVVTQRLINTEKTINGEPLITELRGMLSPDNKLRQEIVNDFKKFQKVYPLKELGWQLVFMLPLFFVFYIWSSRSVKKNSKVQTLIATHLLVVASIPIILKVMEVVLDLIPLHFFKNLFKLLKSLHIIAIWHYVVILISVCATLFAVYVIQKKIFNKKRIQQKRLMKGACYSCGRKLPNSEHTCPFCGTKQQTNCHRCHEKTYVCGDYCKNCGTELLNQEINKK